MRWGKGASNWKGGRTVALAVAFTIAILALSGIAFTLGIGAAPGTINLGEVYRGKRYTAESYIVTTAKSKLVLSLRYAQPHMAWMVNPGPRTDFNLSMGSEEDISSWVKFPQNPVLIDPAYKTYIKLPTGETVAANKKITFYIDIPDDAEPGYHMGSIAMDPQLSSSLGTGVSTIGLSRIVFTFRIPGEVKRELDIIGMEARRTGEKTAEIDVLVKNRGTVTTSFRIPELKVFDKNGNILSVLSSGWAKARPGETRIVTLVWSSKNPIDSEYYTAKAKLSWYYGESSTTEDVYVPEEIKLKREEKRQCFSFPLWFIILVSVSVMVGVHLYRSVPIPVPIILVGIFLYSLISCGRLEVWALLLIVMAYLYDRVGQ